MRVTMGLSHVTVMLMLLLGATAQPPTGIDSSICTPNQEGANNLPNLPASFSMRVEANILNKNMTTTLHEYYNSDANIAAVRQMQDGTEAYFFYYYTTNQLLQVTDDDGNGGKLCFATDLSTSDNQNMFGLQKVNSTSDKIYSVYGALHFGGHIKQKYMGMEMVRGIPCNKWQSCQFWADMNATSNVIWYFSDESQWSSISGYSAPVRCHVTGNRWMNSTYSYPYDHIYEFFDFEAALPPADEHFDVPRNTYCFDEVNRKPLPSMPNAYSFNAELLDRNLKTISFIKEMYDNKTLLVRYDTRDAPQVNSAYGTRYIKQINDYNTGVAYIIDVLQGTCSSTVIAEHGFDNINVDPTHVRIRDPNEFLDLNHDYAYQGVRMARNIECDTWSTIRTDYPDTSNNKNPSTVWTWYFATANWMKQMGYRDNLIMPVMLEIYGDSPDAPVDKIMSFYEYNTEEPDLTHFDISACYGPAQSQNIAFLVPGRYSNIVAGDEKLFRNFVVMSIVAFTSVSPLRVSRIDIQEAGENVLVTFDLLDKAPLTGDVLNPPKELSLTDAVNLLNKAIANGEFVILMESDSGKDLRQLTAKPAPAQFQFRVSSRGKRAAQLSAPSPSSSSSGYSGGAMGGMAVGMLLFGAILGFAIMYVIYRVRGGTLQGGGGMGMRRFENDREQVSDPSESNS